MYVIFKMSHLPLIQKDVKKNWVRIGKRSGDSFSIAPILKNSKNSITWRSGTLFVYMLLGSIGIAPTTEMCLKRNYTLPNPTQPNPTHAQPNLTPRNHSQTFSNVHFRVGRNSTTMLLNSLPVNRSENLNLLTVELIIILQSYGNISLRLNFISALFLQNICFMYSLVFQIIN